MSERRFLWVGTPRMRVAQTLLALALSACKAAETEPRTEILLQIDADSQVRGRAEHLTIELASGAANGETLTESDPEVFDLNGDDFHWPASLALVAKAGHENHVFEATITADAKGMPLTRARVRSAFLKGKTLLLSTSLFGQCIEKFDCADDETCVGTSGGATCVSYVVDQTQLPVFRPTAQAGNSAADGGDAAAPPQTNDSGASAQAGHAGNANTPLSGSVAPPHAGAAGASTAGVSAAGNGGVGGYSPIAGRLAVSGSGATGASGANAAGGGAGTISVPVCVPSGPEQCWNNVDDDCNGAIDCADNACTAGSVCLPATATLGVLVPTATPCPSGYAQGQMPLYQGLMDNGCSGCSCQSTATQCLPHVYYYATTSACSADSVMPYTGGTLINSVPTYTCSSTPFGSAQTMDTPVAWRVTMGVIPGTCSASGGASPLAPVWATQMKLCTRTAGGGGCQPDSVCLPKATGGQTCVQKPDSSGCPGSMTKQVWQRGYSDNRSCGPCTCAANGGDCNNVSVQLGHDWSCGSIDGSLHGGEKSCSISTYAPPAILAGLPTNASCTASAPINGTLTETAPLELCCAP